MNRRDFDIIARATRSVAPDASAPITSRAQWRRGVKALADAIAGADGCSGFDKSKFLEACGAFDATP